MQQAWLYAILSVAIVSLISLVGILPLLIKKQNLDKTLLFLVSFSAGALFGGAFIHLLPEAIEKQGFTLQVSLSLLGGLLIFFILEKFVHWRHCHVPTSKKHPHPLAFMNLIGDGLHNFIDGLIIAGSYLISTQIGIATTIAVIIHEIPQEIGDFGVLLYAGLSKIKALFYNFLSALTAVIGAIFALYIGSSFEGFVILLLPFAAGGFIYIAGSDLIPEMHKTCDGSKSILQLFSLLLGMSIMVLLAVLG